MAAWITVLLLCPTSSMANTGTISKVLSGDLVQIGDSFKAKLTGIKAPAAMDSSLGYKIFDFTKRQLEGKLVKIFTWTLDNTAAGIVYDDDGNAFVQIYFGEDLSVSYNELMLKKGYAKVDTDHLPEDLQHYLDLEQEARDKGLGIWKE